MEDLISVETDMPEVGETVLVYFLDSEIEPELDFVEICSDTNKRYFANDFEGVVKWWCSIPQHPNKHT
jgi:hypothetical protein